MKPVPGNQVRDIATASPALWGWLGRGSAWLFILTLVLVMAAAGWISLQEGLERFSLPFRHAQAAEQIGAAVAQVRAEPTAEHLRAVSVEAWALGQLSSTPHIAESRLMEQGMYFANMPRSNQALMLTHVLLASFCLLFGALQFWPGFRRRSLRLHRLIGAGYVLTVPPSVVAALAYMTLTPPERIYDHLTAWVALWIFGPLALFAVFMALRAIRARRIFEHQGWMALSYGCMLVAPMLRLNWVMLAPGLPGIDQETINLLSVVLILPECMLISYGLILLNRQYQRPLRQRPLLPLTQRAVQTLPRLWPLGLALSPVLAWVNLRFYVLGKGIASLPAAATLTTPAQLAREAAVITAQPITAALMAIGLSLAWPLALLSLRRLLSLSEPDLAAQRYARLGGVLAALAGLGALSLGWQIGVQADRALLCGGAVYTSVGVLLTGFGLALLALAQRGHGALMKESLVFLLCLLPFPALLLGALQIMSFMPLPASYLAAGQGYVLPAGSAASLLTLALLYVIHGQATREHN